MARSVPTFYVVFSLYTAAAAFLLLLELEIAPDAESIAYFGQRPAPLVADGINLASPDVPYLAATRVSLLVPLVTQGRLVGLLALGVPAGGGSYSQDDLAFLSTLADEAAAARIARLLAREATRCQRSHHGLRPR